MRTTDCRNKGLLFLYSCELISLCYLCICCGHPADSSNVVIQALKSNNIKAIEQLLDQNKIDVNVSIQWDRKTLGSMEEFQDDVPLLWLAASLDRLEICKILVKRGANVNAKTRVRGDSVLWIASGIGQNEIVTYLLQNGADPNAPNHKGTAPLHVSTARLRTETMKILLDNGANADSLDNNGLTPLFYAVASRLSKIRDHSDDEVVAIVGACDLLVAHGARVTHSDAQGRVTFLRLCFETLNDEIVLWAVKHGATKLTSDDNVLMSAEDYARMNGNTDLAIKIRRVISQQPL